MQKHFTRWIPNPSKCDQRFNSARFRGSISGYSSGDETSSGIVSDEEIDKQNLGSNIPVYMAKIQEVHLDDLVLLVAIGTEKDDSNVNLDSSNICTNDNQVDQNAAECVDERDALANLIANLTLDTEENKTILKPKLKKANASLDSRIGKVQKPNLMKTIVLWGGYSCSG
ncbi:hypothetical protein Tco_0041139 [Tanacetum coccineum]